MTEIERKWILSAIPESFKNLEPIYYERYLLFVSDESEIRVQLKSGKYEFERKYSDNQLQRTNQKFEITTAEFEYFRKQAIGSLQRESYQSAQFPEVSIKVYKGELEGLIRAEVEFDSMEKALNYQPLDWFGVEITEEVLGRDKHLMTMSKSQFLSEFSKYT